GDAAEICQKIKTLPASVDAALERLDFIAALEAIWNLIGCCNKYIEETKPWNLKKENKTKELSQFIAVLIAAIRAVAEEIAPFMPQTSEKIAAQVNSDPIVKGEPLFPRIDAD
ncbi:MAG: class I tRNA ligase family protein, partial [Candidatus Omnitrophota bacterium]